ncbi:AurF N-oxygenase family protein [Amycolatopsis thermophila]|uniref:ABC-type multidrug transport system fused ATPase/permease subunit n=1 Tax=Amycolatopsis thermophila TaxID=206084 RepID=A0ABU0EPJ4_9PSEU|nr:diiron oxygenase [Amycolatopsis thermophila]MDQ0377221.1 ABC-type multidrug transport system fused ATPase/permease subunit [Amycolatopsis thermophila]
MTRTLDDHGREKTAERLLKSSANKFYDPEVDIDWNAPLAEGKPFQLEHRSSLYGTHLWDRLTPEQRLELGKHELASIASNGIFFEVLLMQMLLKEVYNSDPTKRHVQYALTEIADECRHSTMFARSVERLGAPAYGPVKIVHRLGKLLPFIGYGPALYGSILVAEEILDRIQRESMADENIQPLVRMVNRIHVLEEARHVTFAREEVTRGMANLGRVELFYQRWLIAVVSFAITRSLINPRVYQAVGLNPREAWETAMKNPHWHETLRWSGERIMAFLDEAGLVGSPGTYWWRKSFLLGAR